MNRDTVKEKVKNSFVNNAIKSLLQEWILNQNIVPNNVKLIIIRPYTLKNHAQTVAK